MVELYSRGVTLEGDVLPDVRRTQGVSAGFIKEPMRRTVQFDIEQNGSGQLSVQDVSRTLDELLISGGSLNLKLLGASGESVVGC